MTRETPPRAAADLAERVCSLKPYLLARTSPLTRARKRLPTFDQTFERLAEALDAFDPASVRADAIARAAVAPAAG